MAKGTLVILIFVILALAAIVNFPKDAGAEEREYRNEVLASIELYDAKLMYEDAAEQYYELVRKYPEDRELGYKYAEYCVEHGFNDQAAVYYEKLLENNSKDKETVTRLLELYNSTNSKSIYGVMRKYKSLISDTQIYIDLTEKEFEDLRLKKSYMDDVKDWHDGSYTFVLSDDGKLGVVSSAGEIIVPESFDEIIAYSSSSKNIVLKDQGQLVYADKNGNRKLVPYDSSSEALVYYDHLGPMENGIANIELDGKWGYMNSSMKQAYVKFERTTPFSNGISAAKQTDGWVILNEDLKTISDGVFDDICTDEYGYCCFREIIYLHSGSGWNMYRVTYDKDKTAVGLEKCTDMVFEDVRPFIEYGAVKQGGKWGFVRKDGTWLIEPTADYSDARSFSCGFAPVCTNGKWDFISETGKRVSNNSYESVTTISKNGCVGLKSADSSWKIMQLPVYYYSD